MLLDLVLRPQETPFNDPTSHFLFQKPFVATTAALETFGIETLVACLTQVQRLARGKQGLDYLQVFEQVANPEGPALWFIEDAEVVTALLPSDY
jgi:hypothetical protein